MSTGTQELYQWPRLRLFGRTVSAAQLWEPRDLWVGIFWDRRGLAPNERLYVYVCIAPCFPLRFSWALEEAKP